MVRCCGFITFIKIYANINFFYYSKRFFKYVHIFGIFNFSDSLKIKLENIFCVLLPTKSKLKCNMPHYLNLTCVA